MMNNLNLRPLIIGTLFVIVAVLGIFTIRSILLGNATLVTFPNNTSPEGAIANSIQQSSAGQNGQAALQPGLDFTVKNIHYFDNQTWLVADVVPTGSQSDSGFVVMERVNDTYQLRLGPGGDFSPQDYQSLPQDAAGYLRSLTGQ